MRGILATSSILGVILAVAPLRAEESAAELDEKLLKSAGIATDGPGLLHYLRQRTLSAAEQKQLDDLIQKLGDDQYIAREKASRRLVASGKSALPALRKATSDNDLEVRRRAERAIEEIELSSRLSLPAAAARLVAVRKPADACPVLLSYLPFADDADTEDEVLRTLLAVGVKDGIVDNSLVRALTAKNATQRGAAALVVGGFGTAEQREDAAKLLTDEDLQVRFRAAQGQLAGRVKKAVPALVELIRDGTEEIARRSESLLARVADEKGPAISLNTEADNRKQCRDAWNDWWKANQEKLTLEKLKTEWITSDYSALGRAVAQKFMTAFMNQDAEGIKKSCEPKFFVSGQSEEKGVDEIIGVSAWVKEAVKQGNMTAKLNRQLPVAEFLKAAPEMDCDFVKKQRATQVQLWQVEITEGNQRMEHVILLVRVHGGQARVFGAASLKR